jgi:hypothetical protein
LSGDMDFRSALEERYGPGWPDAPDILPPVLTTEERGRLLLVFLRGQPMRLRCLLPTSRFPVLRISSGAFSSAPESTKWTLLYTSGCGACTAFSKSTIARFRRNERA